MHILVLSAAIWSPRKAAGGKITKTDKNNSYYTMSSFAGQPE